MTTVRYLAPDTDAFVASVERHRDEFERSSRASPADRHPGERRLLRQRDPRAPRRRRARRRLHVRPGAAVGAPDRGLRRAARRLRPPGRTGLGSRRLPRSGHRREPLDGALRRPAGHRSAARDPRELRVLQPRLRPRPARARRGRRADDLGAVLRRRRARRVSRRRRRPRLRPAWRRRLAHDVHRLRDAVLVVRRHRLRPVGALRDRLAGRGGGDGGLHRVRCTPPAPPTGPSSAGTSSPSTSPTGATACSSTPTTTWRTSRTPNSPSSSAGSATPSRPPDRPASWRRTCGRGRWS